MKKSKTILILLILIITVTVIACRSKKETKTGQRIYEIQDFIKFIDENNIEEIKTV